MHSTSVSRKVNIEDVKRLPSPLTHSSAYFIPCHATNLCLILFWKGLPHKTFFLIALRCSTSVEKHAASFFSA